MTWILELGEPLLACFFQHYLKNNIMTGQNCRRSRSTWIPYLRTLWASWWDTSIKKKPPWTEDTWTSHTCTLYGAGVMQPSQWEWTRIPLWTVLYEVCKWINSLDSGPRFQHFQHSLSLVFVNFCARRSVMAVDSHIWKQPSSVLHSAINIMRMHGWNQRDHGKGWPLLTVGS